ncbi:p53-like transcription factor [Terfezia boudieri ATCC MYA-4762]|uniref:p53-like transcription factor n=1 Tax=Terfezia boudieri ATCC MYA-4762 TaxID=1051890 RepID=A0A3N4LT48_9PEZI|nr:p53-like transcription factor [Terfezia boudieri ATCC MYA-4762]
MNSRLGLQMPIKTDIHSPEGNAEREHISHHSLSPLPHRSGPGGIFGHTLPSLQHTPYHTSSSYEHTPSPASTTSLYSHYSYHPAGYPTSASPYSPTLPSHVSPYTMTSDSSRPRIPSIHSPVSHHTPNPVSTSMSARAAYATATPHTSRHHHRSPKEAHTPLPVSRSMRSPTITTSPTLGVQTDPSNQSSVPTGPPMGSTQILCNLFSADGVLVEPEIHGRVEKGFFLAERDWTCYRRNYFTVVCSYSLKPATHSLPFYLKRSPTAQPENVLAFAMCISAVVDAPGGKAVELVQHTPKRDKGPQHRPSKVKLAPQPIGSLGFNASHSQQTQGNDFNPFPQQAQQQNVASFERIQFKSATANNGKRRAAQQYYHLIVELYADVGNQSTTAPSNTASDAGWVKIAYKTSAPMVVRGRSPGHYADERRVQSPGGNNGSGNGSNNTHSPTSNGIGGNMMGSSDMGASSDVLGSNRLNITGMNGYHHMGNLHSAHNSPSPSSIRDPSIATPPPPSHLEGPPIDPVITGDDSPPLENDYTGYQYFPGTIYSGHHTSPIYDVYQDEKRSEGPVVAHCTQFENDISSYIPSTLLGKEQRLMNRKCGPYCDSTDGSRGYFPDLPTV